MVVQRHQGLIGDKTLLGEFVRNSITIVRSDDWICRWTMLTTTSTMLVCIYAQGRMSLIHFKKWLRHIFDIIVFDVKNTCTLNCTSMWLQIGTEVARVRGQISSCNGKNIYFWSKILRTTLNIIQNRTSCFSNSWNDTVKYIKCLIWP